MKVIREEETSNERMLPYDWPKGKSMRAFVISAGV